MAAYEGYPKKATKSWPKHENNLNEDVSGANCTRINIGSSGEIQEIHNSSSNLVKSVVLNLENPELGYPLDVTENKTPFSHKDTVVTISLSSYKSAPTKDSVCSFTLENEVFLNDSVKNDLSKFAANTESSPKVYSSSDEYSEKDFKNGDYCKMEKLYSPMVHVPGDSLKNDMPCQMPGTWNDVSAEDFSGEDFHCYLICYACCHRRILKKGICNKYIVTNTRKYDHITPILQKLHWLPVRQILLITYKSINDMVPEYLCVLVSIRKSSRKLRSSSQILLQVSVSRLKSYGDCVFSVAAPTL